MIHDASSTWMMLVEVVTDARPLER